MKKILLVLALIFTCTIAAGAALDMRAEMAALDRALIPVWALTVEGRLDLATKAMPVLRHEWYGFKERNYDARTADAGWRNDIDRVDALIGEAAAILDGGRYPDLVRTPLERAATVLAGLRQRSGIDYYTDYLIAFRVPMDGIVAAGKDPNAESVARIRAFYPQARAAWQHLPPAGPGPAFHLSAARTEALPGMIEAETKALDDLGRVLDANDAAAIAAAALAIRPPFLSVYYSFGDFHALMWIKPDAK